VTKFVRLKQQRVSRGDKGASHILPHCRDGGRDLGSNVFMCQRVIPQDDVSMQGTTMLYLESGYIVLDSASVLTNDLQFRKVIQTTHENGVATRPCHSNLTRSLRAKAGSAVDDYGLPSVAHDKQSPRISR